MSDLCQTCKHLNSHEHPLDDTEHCYRYAVRPYQMKDHRWHCPFFVAAPLLPMTPLRAVQVIEMEDHDEASDEYNAAWQCLVDTGIVWKLQGWYGRTAKAMIEEGSLTAPGGAA